MEETDGRTTTLQALIEALIEFLEARLAEDEAVAQQVRPDEYLSTRDCSALAPGRRGDYSVALATSGRVLADVESKRRIIHINAGVADKQPRGDGYEEARARRTLKLLALPYSDHPDYRQEWRP